MTASFHYEGTQPLFIEVSHSVQR